MYMGYSYLASRDITKNSLQLLLLIETHENKTRYLFWIMFLNKNMCPYPMSFFHLGQLVNFHVFSSPPYKDYIVADMGLRN